MSNNIVQDSMLSMGSILRGIYRIDSYLSSGGFGNTYIATNVEFDEVVAIKEFFMRGITQRDANNTTVSVSNIENKSLFYEQLQKFKKEARRLRKLKNEHIVSVHDLFEENGTAYYVMDYIDGENLAEKLKRQLMPLSETEVMGYLPQILDALSCVHNEGLWHLDLKPANIMVDRAGNITLIDFGASKQRSTMGGATTSTAVSYTNGFAPREQMEQNLEKFGPWTDFYALGATLYNLLTNKKPPLPSDIDDDRSTDKHLALPMPFFSDEMKKLILWLMKTDRIERPQNIHVLIEQQNLLFAKYCPKESESKDYENEKIFEHTLVNDGQVNNMQEQKAHDSQNEVAFSKRRSFSIIKILVIINILAFLANYVLSFRGIDLNDIFGLHFFLASDFKLFQIITYMFMHGGLEHLFFNMFALWIFGCAVERVWRPKNFIFYYIFCGIGAGLVQELAQYAQYSMEGLAAYDSVMSTDGTKVPMDSYLNLWTTVGASGAIYAIILAFAQMFPKEKIWAFKIKWLIPLIILISLFSASGASIVFSIGKLGGLCVGFFIILYWKRKKLLIFNSEANIWTTKEYAFQINDSKFQRIKLRTLKIVRFFIILWIFLLGVGIISMLIKNN